MTLLSCHSCSTTLDTDSSRAFRIYAIENLEKELVTVCRSCYQEVTVCCSECNTQWHRESMKRYKRCTYCPDCEAKPIRYYRYEPPRFKRLISGLENDNTLMGVEVEVDYGSGREFVATSIKDGNPDVYCVNDGSLSSQGFEIVSHPATLTYHKSCLEWGRIFATCRRNEFKSHDTDTCGLHIHLDNRSLGNSEREIDIAKMKILYFFLHNQRALFRMSRRNGGSVSRYAMPITHGTNHSIGAILSENDDKYRVVNTGRSRTTEFRLWRGTMKLDTFYSALEFVHCLVHYIKTFGFPFFYTGKATFSHFMDFAIENSKEHSNFVKRGIELVLPHSRTVPAKFRRTNIRESVKPYKRVVDTAREQAEALYTEEDDDGLTPAQRILRGYLNASTNSDRNGIPEGWYTYASESDMSSCDCPDCTSQREEESCW